MRARAHRNQHKKDQHATLKQDTPIPKKTDPENPLSKPAGFEWPGTINADDLI
jgi:hypothetical protein